MTKNMVLAAAAFLSIGGFAMGMEPIREAGGERAKELKKLELKPFDASAWSKLSDWKGGEPTATDMTGKVVLIMTWTDYEPTSKKAMVLAKRLAEKHGKDGLLVVGAHKALGWDKAERPAGLRVALDANGEFRAAIKSDNDPDFYLIDRAGQLRYADIQTDSVESAVDELLKEKTDDAASVNSRLAREAEMRAREQAKTDALRGQLDLTSLPEVPFAKPGPKAYEDASWPRLPRDPNRPTYDNERQEPKVLVLPETDWYPRKPKLDGRVIVMYFWHPKILRSFERVMPQVDLMQKQEGRDVVFVGVLTAFETINGMTLKAEDRDPEKLKEAIKTFGESRQLQHFLLLDADQGIYNTFAKDSYTVPWPMVAIASSDNTIRWWVTEDTPNFLASLLKVKESDPGVKARKRAEEAYIKAQGK